MKVPDRHSAEELMLRYLSGESNPEEVSQLDTLLRTDERLLRDMAYLLLQQVQLEEIFGEEQHSAKGHGSVREIKLRRCSGRLAWTFQTPARLAAAAGVVIGAGLLLLFLTFSSSNAPEMTELDGSVLIQSHHESRPALVNAALRPGDWILLGPDGAVTLAYKGEATRVRLTDSARLRVVQRGRGKTLELARGSISAAVAPQPVRAPLRVLTPEVEATVRGTEFTLEAKTSVTRLEVWSGDVELTRVTGKEPVTVRSGESATAAKGLPLHREKIQEGVLREAWRGIEGMDVKELTADPRFPGQPSDTEFWPDLELRSPHGDSYGLRLRGWLHVPASGEYFFWIAADDQAELWLSSDEKPEHTRRLCFTRKFTAGHEWDNSPEQRSERILLEPGRKYYLEVLMKQSAGDECLSVAWQGPNFPRQVVRGANLAPVGH